jgi:hypothetical protein
LYEAELEVVSGSVLALDEGIGPLLNPDDKATMDFILKGLGHKTKFKYWTAKKFSR